MLTPKSKIVSDLDIIWRLRPCRRPLTLDEPMFGWLERHGAFFGMLFGFTFALLGSFLEDFVRSSWGVPGSILMIWDPILEGRRHHFLIQNVLWMVFYRYIVSMWLSEAISMDLLSFRAPQEPEKLTNSLYCRLKTKVDKITSEIGSGGSWTRSFMNLQWFWQPWRSFSSSLGLWF